MDLIEALSLTELAANHWDDEAARLLPNAGKREVFPEWDAAMFYRYEVANLRNDLRKELLGFGDDFAYRAPAAAREKACVERLEGLYKSSLPNVKNAGLIEASIYDITRKAIKANRTLDPLSSL